MKLEDVHKEDFFHCLQDGFQVVDCPSGPCDIHLVEVNSGPNPAGQEVFSLLFRGPQAPFLPQGIHTLVHPHLGEMSLFLVPVGQAPDGFQYEVVFNRIVSRR